MEGIPHVDERYVVREAEQEGERHWTHMREHVLEKQVEGRGGK